MNKLVLRVSGMNHLLVGVIVGMLIGVVPYFITREANPYSNVQVSEVKEVGKSLRVTAHFTKNECTFKRLAVFGIDIGGNGVRVTWEPIDRTTAIEDRVAGSQTLIIDINNYPAYDSYEIRTRHDCGGNRVDKVFVTINPTVYLSKEET